MSRGGEGVRSIDDGAAMMVALERGLSNRQVSERWSEGASGAGRGGRDHGPLRPCDLGGR